MQVMVAQSPMYEGVEGLWPTRLKGVQLFRHRQLSTGASGWDLFTLQDYLVTALMCWQSFKIIVCIPTLLSNHPLSAC